MRTTTLTLNGVTHGATGPTCSTVGGTFTFEGGPVFVGDVTPIPFTMSGNLTIEISLPPALGGGVTEHDS